MDIIEKEMQEREKEKRKEEKFERFCESSFARTLRRFFYFLGGIKIKIEKRKRKKIAFSEKKVKKYLDKVLPSLLSETKLESGQKAYTLIPIRPIYSCNKTTKKDCEFYDKFSFEIVDYYVDKYEIQGYEKIVKNNPKEKGLTHVYFVKK